MSLAKKFDPLFSNKMAELQHCGYVEIYKWELLTWFQRDRITNVVWNEIHDRWVDIWEDTSSSTEENQLLYTDTGKSYVIINKSHFTELFVQE
jgi:hypothetical protein